MARQAEKGGISAFNDQVGQVHVHHDVPSGEFQQRGRATQGDQTIVVAGGQQRQQWSHDRGLASPHDLAGVGSVGGLGRVEGLECWRVGVLECKSVRELES